jgi:hypothetical protein
MLARALPDLAEADLLLLVTNSAIVTMTGRNFWRTFLRSRMPKAET